MFKGIFNIKEEIKTIIKEQASMRKEMTALERKKNKDSVTLNIRYS